jgi:thioredoxin-like negative regulator of GroEL
MLSPVLEELAVEYKGRVRVYKVDIDVERELANSLRIMSIPTLFLVREDGQMKVLQGAVPKTELKKIIDGFLLQ